MTMKYTLEADVLHYQKDSLFCRAFYEFIEQKLYNLEEFPVVELDNSTLMNGLRGFFDLMQEPYVIKLEADDKIFYQHFKEGDHLYESSSYRQLKILDHLEKQDQSFDSIMARLRLAYDHVEAQGDMVSIYEAKLLTLFTKGVDHAYSTLPDLEDSSVKEIRKRDAELFVLLQRAKALSDKLDYDFTHIRLVDPPNPLSTFSVILVNGENRLIIDKVQARDEQEAFYVSAKNHPENHTLVSAHKGELTEGHGFALPGESLVDAETILEQKDVFAPRYSEEDEKNTLPKKVTFKP